MTLTVTGIGPADSAKELAGFGAEYVVVLSGAKEDCKAAAKMLFEEVTLKIQPHVKEAKDDGA